MAYTFDGTNKLIIMSAASTELSVPQLWTDWVNWAALPGNHVYLLAMTSTGGDTVDVTYNVSVPKYVWLENGWRIRPDEANHVLHVIDGVIAVQGGGDPFVDTLGAYRVRINFHQPHAAFVIGTTPLTPQQVRDAMTIPSTGGKPSIDDKLDNNLAVAVAGL